MPCDSSYLEPTGRERELRRSARLLGYLLRQLGRPVSPDVAAAARDIYGGADYVPTLCATLKTMSAEQIEEIVYARNKDARALANWWEDHQEADRKRLLREDA